MAKKGAAGGFNRTEEIRKLLKRNPNLKLADVMESLQKGFPKESQNKNSCSVAFYNVRRELGISSSRGNSSSRGKKARKKAGKRSVVRRKRPATSRGKAPDLEALQAAAKFVAQVGDADKAVQAIRQLSSLQIG